MKPGALLATVDNEGRPNVMTISWGSLGNIWHKPIFTALVRSSRHSYTCLEQITAVHGKCGRMFPTML